MLPVTGLLLLLFVPNLGHARTQLSLDQVAFILMSQPDAINSAVAEESQEMLLQALLRANVSDPKVVLLHRDLPHHGAWTVFPVLPSLERRFGDLVKWFLFLPGNVGVQLDHLLAALGTHAADYELFLGRALTDIESTIIHHFAPPDLDYPDMASGFALSSSLLQSLCSALHSSQHDRPQGFPSDFSIDASYELSKVISLLHKNGPRLINEQRFCVNRDRPDCATFRRRPTSCAAASLDQLRALNEQVLFAVKTCGKFHSSRLPIIRDTWARYVRHALLVSEVEDKELGTVVLSGAESNTEQGHCQKTEAILKHFDSQADNRNWKWLVVADDDTVLGVNKLLSLLHCYDNPGLLIGMGQRYGFRIATGSYGYDYLTGGAGMVFNRRLVGKMMNLSDTHCRCQHPDQPDDMHLGACMTNLGVVVIHHDGFHQGRPEDYNPLQLQHQDVISFHKFWNTDPIKTYDQWFRASDEQLLQQPASFLPHEEL